MHPIGEPIGESLSVGGFNFSFLFKEVPDDLVHRSLVLYSSVLIYRVFVILYVSVFVSL